MVRQWCVVCSCPLPCPRQCMHSIIDYAFWTILHFLDLLTFKATACTSQTREDALVHWILFSLCLYISVQYPFQVILRSTRNALPPAMKAHSRQREHFFALIGSILSMLVLSNRRRRDSYSPTWLPLETPNTLSKVFATLGDIAIEFKSQT